MQSILSSTTSSSLKQISGFSTYDPYLARLLMLSFMLPGRVQVIVHIMLCLYWLIRDAFGGDKKHYRRYGWVLVLSGPYLLYGFYLFLTPEPYRREVTFALEQKASLLLFPLVFLCLRRHTLQTISNEIIYFVFASLLSCLVGNIYYLLHINYYDESPVAHAQYRYYFEEITEIHPAYMGIYLCFSVAILLFSPTLPHKLRGWRVSLLLFPLFVFLVALMPKAAIVALFAILIYYIWTQRQKFTKLIPILIALTIASSIAYHFLPFPRQRLQELSILLKRRSTGMPASNPNDNSIQMRQIIWTINTNLLEKHWLKGVGPGYLSSLLRKQYAAYSRAMNTTLGFYNTHNEYIHQWLNFGLIGIGLLLLPLLVQFTRAVNQNNPLYLSLLLLISITFFTENVLSRQDGVVFYALFSSLFFFKNPIDPPISIENQHLEPLPGNSIEG